MAKENNFTKAVKELLGEKDNMDAASQLEQESPLSTSTSKRVDTAPSFSFDTEPQTATPRPTSTSNFKATGGFSSSFASISEAPSEPEHTPMPSFTPSVGQENQTYINKETVITGSITSKGSICNEGQVTGDISTQDGVCITGKVDGNIDGKSVQIIGGYVVGNITAKEDVSNDFSSIIVGDITGENFSSDGKVKGNLKISNAVSLKSNCIICGNVSARKLSVQDGAVIKGNVQILSPKATDDDTFAIPKGRVGASVEDDVFEIPKHPASKQVDEQEFKMPSYHTPSTTAASTTDLFASLKNRMMDKTDAEVEASKKEEENK